MLDAPSNGMTHRFCLNLVFLGGLIRTFFYSMHIYLLVGVYGIYKMRYVCGAIFLPTLIIFKETMTYNLLEIKSFVFFSPLLNSFKFKSLTHLCRFLKKSTTMSTQAFSYLSTKILYLCWDEFILYVSSSY